MGQRSQRNKVENVGEGKQESEEMMSPELLEKKEILLLA